MAFFLAKDLGAACEKALKIPEEGQELLAKASTLEPGSEEMRLISADLMKRFGSKHLEHLLRSIPPQLGQADRDAVASTLT